MLKNTLLSILIGSLAIYLPIWQWNGLSDKIVGAMSIGVVAFMVLMAAEVEDGTNDKAKS